MTAAYLAKVFGRPEQGGVPITLIESPDIGTIGVGEGSFATIRTTLATLGIDEARFLRESTATFKQGIRFVDWEKTPVTAPDGTVRHDHYFHPFDPPFFAEGAGLLPYWLLQDPKTRAPYGEYGRTASEILTPEGVVLPFINASFGERVGAVLIDLLIMVLAPVLLVIAFIILPTRHLLDDKHNRVALEILAIVAMFFWFFIRSGYFIFFEMGRRAATPGKRLMRLRVIAHDGGRLTPAAVFTRNAMREVELYIPLGLLLTNGGSAGTVGLLAFLWAVALLLLPLFNRQHARLGDFLAGTRVVHMPKAQLSYDLADLDGDRNLGLTFTREQLAYGEMELGVLEQVLRDRKPSVMRAVADKIKARINWQAPKNPADIPPDEAFLRAYYGALRAYLEGRMLLGKRRKDKSEG
jgi:uncharacterized RDD family membrane protein YckC